MYAPVVPPRPEKDNTPLIVCIVTAVIFWPVSLCMLPWVCNEEEEHKKKVAQWERQVQESQSRGYMVPVQQVMQHPHVVPGQPAQMMHGQQPQHMMPQQPQPMMHQQPQHMMHQQPQMMVVQQPQQQVYDQDARMVVPAVAPPGHMQPAGAPMQHPAAQPAMYSPDPNLKAPNGPPGKPM